MNAQEIAQYLIDQEICDEQEAEAVAPAILRSLDFSGIWEQVEAFWDN